MQRVTNIGLAQIISETIWARMGADEDANITVVSSGYGLACGAISTSLRDLARLGIAMLNNEKINHDRIQPRSCIADVNKQGHLCLGVFGQIVYVSPESDMVAVKFSSWPDFQNVYYLRQSLDVFHAISDAFEPNVLL